MDYDNFDIFGNLKNLQDEVYSIPLEKLTVTQQSEDYDGEQFLKSFLVDEAKGKLNSVLKNKESAKTTKNRKRKNKENAGKKVPVKDQPATVNETTLDSTSISQMLYEHEQNKPIAKRLRSSYGKADISISAILEEIIVPPKVIVTKGNRRGHPSRNQRKKGGSHSSSDVSSPNRRALNAGRNAHTTIADFIDLTGCVVLPRVEGLISLDSDDEAPSAIAKKIVENGAGMVNPSDGFNLDNSFDADNPEVSIKIRWNGHYLVYMLRKYQKFSHIMQQISERENVPVEDIVFNLDNKFVKPCDTPDSIGYKVYHFIDGRALKLSKLVPNEIGTNKKKKASKCFHLKVQSGEMKHPLVIELKKTDPLKILFIKCAEELNLQISQLKLCFDGEPLTMSDTAEQLDLDGGEMIEMYIK